MDYDSYLDESGMDELEEIDFDYLTGEELSAYEKEINEAIEKSWEQEDIDRKGLMYYFCCGFEDEKNKEILNKVAAAYPKIETVCGTAYSIMVCDTNQPLMKNEIEILKDYFAGQYSDGSVSYTHLWYVNTQRTQKNRHCSGIWVTVPALH